MNLYTLQVMGLILLTAFHQGFGIYYTPRVISLAEIMLVGTIPIWS